MLQLQVVPPVKSSEMQLMKCGHLTVAELQVAEREIFKHVQQVAFPELIDVLSQQGVVRTRGTQRKLKKTGASICQLNPQLKEGLLRRPDGHENTFQTC